MVVIFLEQLRIVKNIQKQIKQQLKRNKRVMIKDEDQDMSEVTILGGVDIQ